MKQALWKLGMVQNVKKTRIDIGRPTFDRRRAVERRCPEIWRETVRPALNYGRRCDRRLGRHVGGMRGNARADRNKRSEKQIFHDGPERD